LLFLGVVVGCAWVPAVVARVVEGQACGLPVTLPGGAVEARRSRVRRSGIALATPKAPLTWEGRPRRLRGITAGTPRTPHQCCSGEKGGGGAPWGLSGWGRVACSRSVSRVWTGPWGCRSSLRRAGRHGVLRQGAAGRGQSDEATRHGMGVMTSTTRVRPRSWGIMRRGGLGSGYVRRAARRR
jgi:hypothetical protein